VEPPQEKSKKAELLDTVREWTGKMDVVSDCKMVLEACEFPTDGTATEHMASAAVTYCKKQMDLGKTFDEVFNKDNDTDEEPPW
jgi:hypothetical protein